ncbi:MAG: nucleotidyltransferase domain-containing protein [Nanoarchaeota archaeon]
MGKEKIIRLIKHFMLHVNEISLQKIILFGSQATGEATEDSDIDLIVVAPDFEKMNFFERVKKMNNYWNLDYAVDFLCYTPEEFEKKKNRISIVSEALKEGVIIE